MKKITTTVMLFAALAFGFTACQNQNKKAEETTTEETHSEGDGHNHTEGDGHSHEGGSTDAHAHDTTGAGSHEGHDHAPGDTTHNANDGHNH